jgi:hypothetical protein
MPVSTSEAGGIDRVGWTGRNRVEPHSFDSLGRRFKETTKMTVRTFAIALLFLGVTGVPHAEEFEVHTWYGACEELMSTNHFELPAGESVGITVDLTDCAPEQLGGFLFFGYTTNKTSSRPLTSKDRILLNCTDLRTGEAVSSQSGSIYLEVDEPGAFLLEAVNMGRKMKTIRLRSNSGL